MFPFGNERVLGNGWIGAGRLMTEAVWKQAESGARYLQGGGLYTRRALCHRSRGRAPYAPIVTNSMVGWCVDGVTVIRVLQATGLRQLNLQPEFMLYLDPTRRARSSCLNLHCCPGRNTIDKAR